MRNNINSCHGNIYIELLPDNTVRLSQKSNEITLDVQEMEKLAKMLFAKRREYMPAPVSPQSLTSFPVSKIAYPTVEQPKSYMSQQKEKYNNAYKPWTSDENERLREMTEQGKTVQEISLALGRNKGAILSRQKKLGI